MHIHSRVMTDPAAIKRFALAGHAKVTLKSLATEQHYTYEITKADESRGGDTWFVRVLTDRDLFVYAGIVRSNDLRLRLTAKSHYGDDAGCIKAFRYFFSHLMQGQVASQLEVRHEGHCGRCNRPLTHPSSIDRGIGPDCWEQMGMGAAERSF